MHVHVCEYFGWMCACICVRVCVCVQRQCDVHRVRSFPFRIQWAVLLVLILLLLFAQYSSVLFLLCSAFTHPSALFRKDITKKGAWFWFIHVCAIARLRAVFVYTVPSFFRFCFWKWSSQLNTQMLSHKIFVLRCTCCCCCCCCRFHFPFSILFCDCLLCSLIDHFFWDSKRSKQRFELTNNFKFISSHSHIFHFDFR